MKDALMRLLGLKKEAKKEKPFMIYIVKKNKGAIRYLAEIEATKWSITMDDELMKFRYDKNKKEGYILLKGGKNE